MEATFFDKKMTVQALDRWYRQCGKCHVIGSGVVIKEFQENEKPLAGTKSNSDFH